MKKQITLQDIFNQNDELYKNLIDSITKLEEKISGIYESAKNAQQDTETQEIPNTEYVSITEDDVFVGGKPATHYNGQEIYNRYHCPAYFKEVRDIIRKEYGYELEEIHCLQSSTGGEYAKSGNPIPDKNGTNSWIRVIYKDKEGMSAASLWVFNRTYSSGTVCASTCAIYCGFYARYYSDLRGGLFGSVRN